MHESDMKKIKPVVVIRKVQPQAQPVDASAEKRDESSKQVISKKVVIRKVASPERMNSSYNVVTTEKPVPKAGANQVQIDSTFKRTQEQKRFSESKPAIAKTIPPQIQKTRIEEKPQQKTPPPEQKIVQKTATGEKISQAPQPKRGFFGFGPQEKEVKKQPMKPPFKEQAAPQKPTEIQSKVQKMAKQDPFAKDEFSSLGSLVEELKQKRLEERISALEGLALDEDDLALKRKKK